MTTTVKVYAHCDNKTEVKIKKEDGENVDVTTIQDGEEHSLAVYDDIKVTVEEFPKD